MAAKFSVQQRFDREVRKFTGKIHRVVDGFCGKPGSKTAAQVAILKEAAGEIRDSAKLAAPGPTLSKWWSGKYPKYWRYVYAIGRASKIMHVGAPPRAKRFHGKVVIAITKTKKGTPKRLGVVVAQRKSTNTKSNKYGNYRNYTLAWTKTLRPRNRLVPNLSIKEPKTSDSNNRSYVIYPRRSKSRTMWDKRNAWYAYFLELGTKRAHKHPGIRSSRGWYTRGTRAGQSKAKQVIEAGVNKYFKEAWSRVKA